jgi:hypothetical protein
MSCVFRFCLSVLLLVISSCAIQVAPTGGDKDVKPPVVKSSSPENFSTNFHGHDISISFDEYVTLKDLNAQFIASPPLKYQPDTKVKKKTLQIHLDDTLRENTTYTMNFGNAITDLREGNALENYQYVFSTGDILDSLTVSGHASNAFDSKTEKGIYVMLYHGTDDSLPLKTLPDYFTKTAEDGSFEIKNVSPGAYKIFALKDNNSNYLFDNADESIAFDTAQITAGKTGVTLSIFKEIRKQQVLKASAEEPGKVLIVLARPFENEHFIYLTDTSSLHLHTISYSEKRDSITFWYRNLQSDSLALIFQHDTISDSLSIRLKHFDQKFRAKNDVALTTQYTSKSENPLDLNKPVQLVFNHPVDSFDLEKISVREDSIPVTTAKIYFNDPEKQKLIIDFQRKEKTTYTIGIPKNTFKDILELRNDSLEFSFTTKTTVDYGTMAVTVRPGTGAKNFIVQVMDDKENIYRQSIIHSDTVLNYDYLEPRIYRLKMIEDINENNEWDPGDYLKHRQPERVFYYKENLTVRANWDVDVKWDLSSTNY